MISSRAPDPAQPGPPAWRRGLGVLALAVLVAVIAASDALHDPLARLLALTEGMIHDSPRLGPVLFVLFAALSGILAFFSSAVIVPIAVHAWGPARCVVLLWLGWLLGGAVTYLIGRTLGRPVVRRLASAELLARYEQKLGQDAPFGLVALFQLAMPSEVPGYVLGLVRYSFVRYIVVVAGGELLWAAGTVLLGDSLIERRVAPALAIGAAAALLSAIAYARLHRRLADRPDVPR